MPCACRFGCLLEYVQQPLAKAPANITEVLSKVPCPRHIFHMDLATTEPKATALTRTHASSGLSKAPQLQSQAGTQRAALLPGALSSNMLMCQAQLHPVSQHGQANRAYAMAAEEGVAEPAAAEDYHAETQGAVVPRQGGMGGSISQSITPIGDPGSWSCAVLQCHDPYLHAVSARHEDSSACTNLWERCEGAYDCTEKPNVHYPRGFIEILFPLFVFVVAFQQAPRTMGCAKQCCSQQQHICTSLAHNNINHASQAW